MSLTEDELIAEMAKAWRRISIGTHTTVMDSAGLRAALGAVEPLIRADERERIAAAIKEVDVGYDDDYGWIAKKAYAHAARIARNGERQ